MHNTYFHIMHSTLQYGHSFDSNWQIYDSFNRKHKRLLDTYQEIRPDNFSFDTLCKKYYVATKLYSNSFLDYNRFSANVLYDYNCKYMYIKMKCFLF